MQETQMNGMFFKYLVSKLFYIRCISILDASLSFSLSLFQSSKVSLSIFLSFSLYPSLTLPLPSLPHKDIEGARGWTKTNMQNDTLNHKTKIQNDITFTSTRLKFSKRQRPSAYSSDCTCTM